MIGAMDRKAVLYNPVRVKEASGGYATSWATWATVWCNYTQRSGKPDDSGGQLNLYTQATVVIRYSSEIRQRLSKNTVFVIRDVQYNVTDFDEDYRKPFVEVQLTAKHSGSPLINQNDLLVQARIYTITGSDAGDGSQYKFHVSWLENKTVLSVVTGRALPCEVITDGAPDVRQFRYYSDENPNCEVNQGAPLIEGEQFEFIYR